MKTIIAACSQNLSGSRASIQTALRTLLAVPWPSQRDIGSALQLLAVLQWVLSFLLLGTISLLLLIYLLFTSLWLIPVLYLAWIILDWDTPEKGGRRLPCLRRWTVWKHFRDYFPVKVRRRDGVGPSKRRCHRHVPVTPFVPAAGEDTRPVPQPQLHHRFAPPWHPLCRRVLQLHHRLHGLRGAVPGHPLLPHHTGRKLPPARVSGVPDEWG
uniref:Uncharacterized protein n=1 Tax=Cyanoderma ruficeps TaxID=181631 RepID=A0A8C3R914_9PASS